MNLEINSLYGGIAGVGISVDSFDLGQGVVLRRTSANFIAPFMMKFPPAATANFGKMGAVGDGINLDIRLELYVPSIFQINLFFDRLNTLWWLTALMRLRGAHRAQLPYDLGSPVL